MGLIKAGIGALGGTLADQWKEFFYCDSLENDVLMVKGSKRISGRSSNTKGNDNIISNGSGIAVADGQCMIIVEQGKIVEVCAEPGEFTYDSSTEPSIFSGSLGDSIKETFKQVGKRFTFGTSCFPLTLRSQAVTTDIHGLLIFRITWEMLNLVHLLARDHFDCLVRNSKITGHNKQITPHTYLLSKHIYHRDTNILRAGT